MSGAAADEATLKRCADGLEIVSRLYRRHGYKDNIRPAQYEALRFFARNPGARLSDFARYRRSTIGSTSTTATRLVERGLLQRSPFAGRNVGLQPTDAGLQALRSDPMRALTEALGGMDAARLGAMADALEELIERLDDDPADGS